MKKVFVILTAILLTLSFAAAEVAQYNSVTLAFDANATTGYSWTGFVLGGDSVILMDPDGSYMSDPNPNQLDGVGGKTYFTVTAVKPGRSIITFDYRREWEGESADREVFAAIVNEELIPYVVNITNDGLIIGTVLKVNSEDHSVLLGTETQGDVIARFDDDVALPVQDEHICIYTDGTMTMSLPPIMNVITWSTIPDERGR